MRLISILPVIMLPLALAAPVPDTDPLASASSALSTLNSSLASSLSSAEVAYIDGVIAAAAALQKGGSKSKSKRQGVTEELDNLLGQLGVSTSGLGLAGVVKGRQLDGLDPLTIVTGLLNGLGLGLKERDENAKRQLDGLDPLTIVTGLLNGLGLGLKERSENTKRQDAVDALGLDTLLEPLSGELGPVTSAFGDLPLVSDIL